MNLILSIPMEARLAAVFVLGACLGGAVNLAIYRLAWHPRPISPWSRPDRRPRRDVSGTGCRSSAGWGCGGRRTARGRLLGPAHAAGIAVSAIGLPGSTGGRSGPAGLLPPGFRARCRRTCRAVLHLEFAAHAVLIALMLAASMIDVDEKIIPDEITIPGTLLGLLVAAAWPWSLLPDAMPGGGGPPTLDFLHLASPNPWPALLGGAPVPPRFGWGWLAGGCGARRCCRGRGTRGTAGGGRRSSAGPESSASAAAIASSAWP